MKLIETPPEPEESTQGIPDNFIELWHRENAIWKQVRAYENTTLHHLHIKGIDEQVYSGWGIIQTDHGADTPNNCCPYYISRKNDITLKSFHSHFEWTPPTPDEGFWVYYAIPIGLKFDVYTETPMWCQLSYAKFHLCGQYMYNGGPSEAKYVYVTTDEQMEALQEHEDKEKT